LEDRQISARSVADQLSISLEQVGSIIHEDLDMLVACFLPGRAKGCQHPCSKSSLSSKAPRQLPPWYYFVGFHIGSNADVVGLGGNICYVRNSEGIWSLAMWKVGQIPSELPL
jgi:hypothetical protein